MTQSHEAAVARPNIELVDRSAETFFGHDYLWIRPEPEAVANLIRDGLTEADIYAAGEQKGYEAPIIAKTLADLDACLPYFQRVNDTLAATNSGATRFFAGRDAELLYDDYVITHPGEDAHLLPASTRLWNGGMSGFNGKFAEPFLGQYRLTREALLTGQNRYELVDSGRKGSVGILMDEVIMENYGPDARLMPSGRLDIKLVCALDKEHGGHGEQIMDLAEDEVPQLQRSAAVLANPENRVGLHGNTYELLVALQTMPRYHGEYAGLISPHDAQYVGLIGPNDDRIVVRPVDAGITQDVDGAYEDDGNASVVNPLAAAIVQFRVVRAALERSAQLVDYPQQ